MQRHVLPVGAGSDPWCTQQFWPGEVQCRYALRQRPVVHQPSPDRQADALPRHRESLDRLVPEIRLTVTSYQAPIERLAQILPLLGSGSLVRQMLLDIVKSYPLGLFRQALHPEIGNRKCKPERVAMGEVN